MKMHMVLTVVEGPNALRHIAVVQGIAHSLGLALRLEPEEDAPKRKTTTRKVATRKKRIAKVTDRPKDRMVRWVAGVFDGDEIRDEEAHQIALEHMKLGESRPKIDLVRALAKRLGRSPRVTGLLVRTWLRVGLLEEIP